MCREDGFSETWRQKLRLDFELRRGEPREKQQEKQVEVVIKMGTFVFFFGLFLLSFGGTFRFLGMYK